MTPSRVRERRVQGRGRAGSPDALRAALPRLRAGARESERAARRARGERRDASGGCARGRGRARRRAATTCARARAHPRRDGLALVEVLELTRGAQAAAAPRPAAAAAVRDELLGPRPARGGAGRARGGRRARRAEGAGVDPSEPGRAARGEGATNLAAEWERRQRRYRETGRPPPTRS